MGVCASGPDAIGGGTAVSPAVASFSAMMRWATAAWFVALADSAMHRS